MMVDDLLDGIDAVLFDFDGTLFDASEVICRSFAEALEACGQRPFDENWVRAMIGRPLREMFEVALPEADELLLDRCVVEYRAAFAPMAVSLSRLLPGVASLIEYLVTSGRLLAVVTTRTADGAAAILAGFELREAFTAIIGLEHVKQPKPDPEPVLLALETLGVTPDHALMVGDTPDDALAGRAAGVSTLGVTTGVHQEASLRAAGAQAVVPTLESLLEPHS